MFFFFSFPQILIYLTMQWEMMSHFNEKHKEIEKPRCYFLSSVVLCVFFFSSCCCSNERKLGENYSITSSPSPSHTSTPPPPDSLNRHVLTRVDLCCKSCYWFLFFIFFSRWCSAVASCVPFLLHILSTDQCSMAALCYLLLQRTATDKRRKKKTCTKIVGRGNRKLRWCCFFVFCFCISLLLRCCIMGSLFLLDHLLSPHRKKTDGRSDVGHVVWYFWARERPKE